MLIMSLVFTSACCHYVRTGLEYSRVQIGLGGARIKPPDCRARLGEVIEAGSAEFVGQSYVLHQAPPLGSLICTNDGEIIIYAITSAARTASVEPGRRPLARGVAEDSEDDLFHNNPELAELLRTEFTAVIVGYRSQGDLYQYLPPRPPHVHSFVYACPPAEAQAFSSHLYFLPTLLQSGHRGSSDEVVAACVREAAGIHSDPRAYLLAAGKELAVLLGAELPRLNSLLRRIRP